jgi:crotonobetainyl-CoA:carnitine CoA-transferase CaiB-like acyl-CoA transferase
MLELVQKGPGSFVTMMFADMGADVIKIEPPAHARESGSGGSTRAADARAQAANTTNRGKRSMVLDLKESAGQAVLHKLCKKADVLIEGFRPGVAARLAVDYPTARELNPSLVYCSLSGFGQYGPYRDIPGHDINYIGMAGVLNLIGEIGRPPVVPPNLIADYGGAALHAVSGILMALFVRERTGKGQQVDIAYFDSAFALMSGTRAILDYLTDGSNTERGSGPLGGSFPYYTVYETRDGGYVTVGCIEPWLWKNLCNALMRPDLVEAGMQSGLDKAVVSERQAWCRDQLAQIFRSRDRDEWFEWFQTANVCVGKVNNLPEVFADPQLRARDMVLPLQHPELGAVVQVGIAIKLSETPGRVRSLAPWKGQHSDEILSDLGYGRDDIAVLRERKVI